MIFYKFYVLNAAFIPLHKNSRKSDVAACSNYHSSEINAASHSKALRYTKISLKITHLILTADDRQ